MDTYGPSVARGEARTQGYIAAVVNSGKNAVVRVPRIYYAFRYYRVGYIIMEHVGDDDYNEQDFPAIAIAVERLLSQIPDPTAAPGPVGGGPITHRFFSDHGLPEDLQSHVNNMSSAFYSPCQSFT
ncbi:hypothetical protein BOTBODRAFT_189012 [Botryobasidium botryosum FD-172 SS1]|uniref:Uncharacterized protein n=1 Tax=Botryobasidium botryosum (strain FD-172 SS1) TaxID=930990 RepID=A0A067MDG5_BOTB1|nr:hypothetical protein BOTBODRAFT_189012 [Botryobasidium botryosum FD-172 SS1]